MDTTQHPQRKPAGFLLRKEMRRQWKVWRAQLIARFSQHHSEDPVFIVGCGRSGTTILGQALAQHPQVAWLDEPRDAWTAAFPRADVWTVAAPLRQGRLRLSADDADARGADRIRRCFGYEQHRQQRARLLEKLPENAFRLPFLEALFPQARYIHLWRNGVEVARSIEQKIRAGGWYGSSGYKWRALQDAARSVPALAGLPFGELTPFERGLLEWRLSVELAEPFLAQLPPQRHRQVDYAALVEEPVATLNHLCDFLQLPHDPMVQAFAESKLRRLSPPDDGAALSPRALAIGGRWLADGRGYT